MARTPSDTGGLRATNTIDKRPMERDVPWFGVSRGETGWAHGMTHQMADDLCVRRRKRAHGAQGRQFEHAMRKTKRQRSSRAPCNGPRHRARRTSSSMSQQRIWQFWWKAQIRDGALGRDRKAADNQSHLGRQLRQGSFPACAITARAPSYRALNRRDTTHLGGGEANKRPWTRPGKLSARHDWCN
ncbi:hypothetical protein EJ04DRAFT_95444 [Polyplosphaeria fusca]|uniref:Uncharacterized protein n=1 Tax=Polyplosphaeria fusca TaxID=682080 RepID=A0A9P4R772_9PLEO|nr:hypothetical protein EJ04DRAFT_95444 [Polyplosphaeria fusca]